MGVALGTGETGGAPIRLLTFTTLYPNSMQPSHGVFVEQRLRHLVASGGVESKVVAPVAWFPFRNRIFGQYAVNASVPASENRYGIAVLHPRYPLVPKVGMASAPFLLAAAVKPYIQKLFANGYRFDLIDAHYFYPDGVAASAISRMIGCPLIITARGTDINLIPRYHIPRRLIVRTALRADAIITVCEALKEALVALGVPADKIISIRNGVDPDLFRPDDRQAWRARLGVSGTTLVSVGHLIKRKGHDLVIRAVAELEGVSLLIAGDGREKPYLKSLARALGISDRVTFLGNVPQEHLRGIYNAADALVLASSREGWPNVLLEAMACGTPVIASAVWGTPEVVKAPAAGVLLSDRTPAGIVNAFGKLFATYPDRNATRKYAEQFGWQATSAGQKELFVRVLREAKRRYSP
jgi:glycosyltransferase involved in cell wall biosynthesis